MNDNDKRCTCWDEPGTLECPVCSNLEAPRPFTIPKGQAFKEYIKAQVKADPLVIQDRRVLWERFYRGLKSNM